LISSTSNHLSSGDGSIETTNATASASTTHYAKNEDTGAIETSTVTLKDRGKRGRYYAPNTPTYSGLFSPKVPLPPGIDDALHTDTLTKEGTAAAAAITAAAAAPTAQPQQDSAAPEEAPYLCYNPEGMELSEPLYGSTAGRHTMPATMPTRQAKQLQAPHWCTKERAPINTREALVPKDRISTATPPLFKIAIIQLSFLQLLLYSIKITFLYCR
jgi:hypothetical protein